MEIKLFSSSMFPTTTPVAPNSRPRYKHASLVCRSSEVVHSLLKYSLRTPRSITVKFFEKLRSESERRSANIVPRDDEVPGDPRKKSITSTEGLLSARF